MDYLWIDKRVQISAPQWTQSVVSSPTCPDQRKYRRMTRAERIAYEKSSR